MLHFNVYLSTSLFNPQGQLEYVGYPQSVKGDAGFGVRYNYNAYGYQTNVASRDNNVSGASDIYWQANSRYDDGSLASAINGGAPYDKDYDTLGRLATVRLKNGATNALV